MTSKKGPIIEGGICRCCGLTKKCRLLNVEYEFYGQKEIYSEIFVGCFGLVLSHLEGEEMDRLICATCVTRLRDASAFKHQVLQCEEKLLQAQIQVDDGNKNVKEEIEIKIEGTEDYETAAVGDDTPDTDTLEINVDHIAIPVEPPKKKLRKRVVKKSVVDEHLRAKKEMLLKIKKMREKLKKIQANEEPPPPPPKWTSGKAKAFHNIITLVENSYVCPFVTTFSNCLCVYCKEMFSDPDKLRAHNSIHDPRLYQDTVTYKKELQIDIARIDCRLCPEPISNLEDFYKHITNIHKKKLYPNIKNEFLKYHLKIGTQSCMECGSSFDNFHALKRHMAEHFGTCICDICGGHFFEENRLIIHQRSHKVKKNNVFTCKECGKLFKSKHGMYYHISRAHKAEPTFQCYKCDEVLFSQILRYRHMIEVHGEIAKKFPCERCDKVYDTKRSLREHDRKSHLKVLKHECSICERKFYLPSALKDHMASHTGERNFRCEYCGKSYPRMRALRVHMQSHETEKRYKCMLCTASYTQSNNLKNHIKTKHQGNEYLENLQ